MADNGHGGEFVNADEAAQILGVSPPAIVRAIRAGRLPALKLDRTWRIPRAALVANGHHAAGGARPSSPPGDPLALIADARASLDQAERAIRAEREGRS